MTHTAGAPSPAPLNEQTERLRAALARLQQQTQTIDLERAAAVVETAYTAIDTMNFQCATEKGEP